MSNEEIARALAGLIVGVWFVGMALTVNLVCLIWTIGWPKKGEGGKWFKAVLAFEMPVVLFGILFNIPVDRPYFTPMWIGFVTFSVAMVWAVKVLEPLIKPVPSRTATVKLGVHNIGILSGPGYPKNKIVGAIEESQTYTVFDEKDGLDNDTSMKFYRIGPNQWVAAKYVTIVG